MSDKYFLDSNIFVYCFDRVDKAKNRKANTLVEGALKDHRAVISSQVIQEFLNLATTKFSAPMSEEESRKYMDRVLAPLCEVFVTLDLLKEALSIKTETGFSFYDSLILAAAMIANCSTVYSEDMNAGQKVRGVTIRNPFS
jgi:predicted nucleic acid-binding protein